MLFIETENRALVAVALCHQPGHQQMNRMLICMNLASEEPIPQFAHKKHPP